MTFCFGNAEKVAFQELKSALCNKPVLKIFHQGLETELHTDASADGFGAILLQRSKEDNQFHPVSYMS